MSTKTKTKTTTVEGPTSSSVTRTTRTTKYNPVVSRKTTVIQRSAGAPTFGGGSMIERSVSHGYHSMPQMGAGVYTNVAAKGVSKVEESRANEKKDMQDLNERFSNYIEKVRYLEAQNKKLLEELDKLKSKWGKETTQIKEMYQTEIEEARRLLLDAENGKTKMEIDLASLEDENNSNIIRIDNLEQENAEYCERLDEMVKTLGDLESEVNQLRGANENLSQTNGYQKREIERLKDLVKKLRTDCDAESLNHVQEANRAQCLEEELEFNKMVHDQELKELAALVCKDNSADNREFWKNEMGKALSEITKCYEDKMDDMRGEMEGFYQMKLQEFRTGATKQNMEAVNSKEETKRLRSMLGEMRDKNADLDANSNRLRLDYERKMRELEDENRSLSDENNTVKNDIVKLRAELEAIMQELQVLMDRKMGLELEIAAYRKLLEGEENRVGLRQVVSSMMSSSSGYQGGQQEYEEDDGALRVSQVVKGQMSAKTTYQRSAKGPVSVKETSADGNTITLENTSRNEVNLSGYKVKRVCDGKEKMNFTLPRGTILQGNSALKLYSTNADSGSYDEHYDINTLLSTFGNGSDIITSLVDNKEQEKASHIQKTSYK